MTIDVLNTIPEEVSQAFLELGVPQHVKGYNYLRYAVALCMKQPEKLDYIVKEVYVDVAAAFETTSSRVERAMRHAIDITWSRSDLEALFEFFGNTISSHRGKPTVSEFLALMSNTLREGRFFRNQPAGFASPKDRLERMRIELLDKLLREQFPEYAKLYKEVHKND